MNSLGKFPHLHDQQGSLLGVSIPAATHVGSIFSSKKWLSLLALIGLAYRASYSIKFTQQISPLTLNCAFTMPKPQPTSPAAVEAFQRGQPRPPSLLPGFLGSCHLRFLCSQRFFDLILSRSKDRRDFLLVDTESCTNKASTFIFIIRFCVKPHVKTPCWETEMKLPKPFFLCLIQTTPFLKRTFQFQFFRISDQRPKTKSKADSIAQEPTKKHPSITNSKNLPPTIGIYIYSIYMSLIFFQIQVAFTSKMPGKKRPATGILWQIQKSTQECKHFTNGVLFNSSWHAWTFIMAAAFGYHLRNLFKAHGAGI